MLLRTTKPTTCSTLPYTPQQLRLLREHFVRQSPALALVSASVAAGEDGREEARVTVKLSVPDMSLVEQQGPVPPVGVDWDVSWQRAGARQGAKWAVVPCERESAEKTLPLPPGAPAGRC